MGWSGMVGGSLWRVSLFTRQNNTSINIQEYQPTLDRRPPRLLQQVEMVTDSIQGRVLSCCQVIGRQGHILVAQFVTHKLSWMQFLVADLFKKKCFTFSDTMRHFQRSYALVGMVQCCVSPDLHMMLLRLPREVARAHTTSLVLVAKPVHGNQPIAVDDNPVTATARFRVTDRRHCTMLFDPRFARRLVSVFVNEFCTKCMFLCKDQDTDTTLISKKERLGQLNPFQMSVAEGRQPVCLSQAIAEDSGNSSEEEEEDQPLIIFRTVSSTAQFSRSGERLVVCCLVEDSLRGGTFLRAFVFHTDTYTCLSSYYRSLPSPDPTVKLSTCYVVLSPCDTKANVFLAGEEFSESLCTVNLCKEVSLKNSCRASILNSLAVSSHAHSLPLPPSLKHYLMFAANKHGRRGGQMDEE